MEKFSILSKRYAYKKLSEELEDLEEEKTIVLSQTGLHLPGSTITRYESESTKLQESIVALKVELEHRI